MRVNDYYTEWFDVQCGLRQGCSLTPLLLNIFVNDFAIKIKAADDDICLENDRVCVFFVQMILFL